MQAFRIVLLSIAASVAYGLTHDQVTARICVEYFTLGHPRLIESKDPTLLGLAWGVAATWWVGLGLGVLLAMASRRGPLPKLRASDLVRPITIMLLVTAAAATVAGLAGWIAASRGWVQLADPFASLLPAERQVGFITDLWIHLASYGVSALGSVALCAWVMVKRRGLATA